MDPHQLNIDSLSWQYTINVSSEIFQSNCILKKIQLVAAVKKWSELNGFIAGQLPIASQHVPIQPCTEQGSQLWQTCCYIMFKTGAEPHQVCPWFPQASSHSEFILSCEQWSKGVLTLPMVRGIQGIVGFPSVLQISYYWNVQFYMKKSTYTSYRSAKYTTIIT